MTEPPAGIPATTEEWRQARVRRPPPLTRRRLLSGATQALVWAVLVSAALAVAGYALYTPRRSTEAAQRMAWRELAIVLDAGETVERSALVSRRHWWNYFHPTSGVLAYTDRRVVWVGTVPRGLIEWDDDEPAAFETRTWPHDSVAVSPARPVFGLTRGVALTTRDVVRGEEGVRTHGAQPELFTVSRGAWASMLEVTAALERRQTVLRAAAERERQRQEYEAWLARQPVYHIVRSGDAVSSVAAAYGLTPDSLRRLNGLTDDRIQAGARLLVKPGS
ncbi:MAG: LysM peptidoglycan-binding domain-containing protein [Actinomycetota bacterium]|nr:LysM peptidoglycan-binding domain-containing protein [Actinomycetota bacterium]